MVLGYIVIFAIFYVFAQSAFISHLKGTAVKITRDQFPDLHEKIIGCCKKLDLKKAPDAYILHVGGVFNAFATRFLGRNFIVLFSDIVDALEQHPDALNFYIGHEVGHIKRNHRRWGPVLAPAGFLPLIGSAYARSREYTCDRHGLAACSEPASAQLGLAALAAGGKRWQSVNGARYVSQTRDSSGFWMSLHELIADYPWLTKRVAAVHALANGGEVQQPRRHPIAWLLAAFLPRFGIAGGASSGIVTIAMIGILAAIALPAYQEYTARAQMAAPVSVGRQATATVTRFYQANKSVPQSLDQAGFALPASASSVQDINIDPTSGVINVTVSVQPYVGKSIVFTPSLDAQKKLVWHCGSVDIKSSVLPMDCRN